MFYELMNTVSEFKLQQIIVFLYWIIDLVDLWYGQ